MKSDYKDFVKKFGKAGIQLIITYLFLLAGAYWGLLFTKIYDYSNKSAWWAVLLRSFPIITIPTSLLIFLGMVLPPLSPEPHKVHDWDTEIVIRWTTRGTYPELVRYVVKTSFMALRKVPNIRLEVVTDTAIQLIESLQDDWRYNETMPELRRIYGIYHESVIPTNYQCAKGSQFKARALEFGAKHSLCHQNAYILHLDEESIIDESLILGVRQFISSYAGYIGQGIISYANTGKGFQSWFCHLADAMRTGDDYARFRLQLVLSKTLVGMKGSFMLIPNSIEQEMGFDHGPHSSITEDCWLGFSNWNSIKYCPGVLREQSPFTILDLIKQRRRWASGLWLVIIHHPIVWYKKTILFLQMIAWVLSPLVVVSFISSFVLFRYRMPTPLAIILGFNFSMFNLLYVWGNLHLIHRNFFIKLITTFIIPILLPVYMTIEGFAGVYGTICPVKTFTIIDKNSDKLSTSSTSKNDRSTRSVEMSQMEYNENYIIDTDPEDAMMDTDLEDLKCMDLDEFKNF